MNTKSKVMAEYDKLMAERRDIISTTRSRAWQTPPKPALPVPPKPDHPMMIEVYDTAGEYVGCWPAEDGKDDAIANAEELGVKVGKTKLVKRIN